MVSGRIEIGCYTAGWPVKGSYAETSCTLLDRQIMAEQKKLSPIVRLAAGLLGLGSFAVILMRLTSDEPFSKFGLIGSCILGIAFLYAAFVGGSPKWLEGGETGESTTGDVPNGNSEGDDKDPNDAV